MNYLFSPLLIPPLDCLLFLKLIYNKLRNISDGDCLSVMNIVFGGSSEIFGAETRSFWGFNN